MISVSSVNALGEVDFVKLLESIYENSAWVAAAAATRRPFANAETLRAALQSVVDEAGEEAQRKLIGEHPDLAGRLARAGELTEASTQEQGRLGLDQLNDEEYKTFDRLNEAYQERFQFPFVICVGLVKDRKEVLDAFHQRIEQTPEEEHQTAIREIHKIARIRLRGLIEGFA
ncbi:MAG: 2-oxo-4-hydroxy-4-carboxy-5-ureidoimidazoline decarboxylase [Verrucomicrobiota bacterium]